MTELEELLDLKGNPIDALYSKGLVTVKSQKNNHTASLICSRWLPSSRLLQRDTHLAFSREASVPPDHLYRGAIVPEWKPKSSSASGQPELGGKRLKKANSRRLNLKAIFTTMGVWEGHQRGSAKTRTTVDPETQTRGSRITRGRKPEFHSRRPF